MNENDELKLGESNGISVWRGKRQLTMEEIEASLDKGKIFTGLAEFADKILALELPHGTSAKAKQKRTAILMAKHDAQDIHKHIRCAEAVMQAHGLLEPFKVPDKWPGLVEVDTDGRPIKKPQTHTETALTHAVRAGIAYGHMMLHLAAPNTAEGIARDLIIEEISRDRSKNTNPHPASCQYSTRTICPRHYA